MAACRSCGAAVKWAMMAKGKKMPIDPRPDERGNLVLEADMGPGGASVKWRVRVVRLPQDAGATRYISHFATCPNSRRHRRAS